MISAPYGFLDSLFPSLSKDQLETIQRLDAPQWTSAARLQLQRRRYFDVDVTVYYNGRENQFKKGRYGLAIREIPKDDDHRDLFSCTTLSKIKSLDQKFVKFNNVTFQFRYYIDGRFTSSLDSIVDYITPLLDSGSCLRILADTCESEAMGNNFRDLLETATFDQFLKFEGLELHSDRYNILPELSTLLKYHVDNNENLKFLNFADRSYWDGQKDVIMKFVNRKGPKTLCIGIDMICVAELVENWLKDPSFELKLCVNGNWPNLEKVRNHVHYYGQDEENNRYYGRIHPENEKSCVVIKLGEAEDDDWGTGDTGLAVLHALLCL
ncbi:hypothetical protein QR680_007400 [Steinernema hermaphroditum]|uniref:F-box domain-containing protein n=1 Tax=Steinernema hermaphroditum TaxID=289476 RepID=A0AA39IEN2_9BILA|nr:hypothetical protein QR680_007400 [Steinernema hermaphroditum]